MGWMQLIRVIPNFPVPGVLFRDILPVMADRTGFQDCLGALEALVRPLNPNVLMAPEARGFLLAAPLADRLKTGVVPVRKPGKLPGPVLSQSYALEYGESRLEIEEGQELQRQRVVIVDDVLATGGTVMATAELAEQAGGVVVGFVFLIELTELGGRDRLAKRSAQVASALLG